MDFSGGEPILIVEVPGVGPILTGEVPAFEIDYASSFSTQLCFGCQLLRTHPMRIPVIPQTFD